MHTRISLISLAAAILLASPIAAAAAEGGRPFAVDMTGSQEAPDDGDPDATGHAQLRVNPGLEQVCFDLSWENIDGTVAAAHIHVAPAGQPGPIVVPLFAGSFQGTDAVSDCVEADRAVATAILRDPDAYYVNVHSDVFPAGAIRGQLSR